MKTRSSQNYYCNSIEKQNESGNEKTISVNSSTSFTHQFELNSEKCYHLCMCNGI